MKLTEPNVGPTRHPSVTQPRSLKPTRHQQPINERPQPTFLQLTPPLRINPFRIRLDKRHHPSISDHECGSSTNTTERKATRPACEGPESVRYLATSTTGL
jgi:hypothetical protein